MGSTTSLARASSTASASKAASLLGLIYFGERTPRPNEKKTKRFSGALRGLAPFGACFRVGVGRNKEKKIDTQPFKSGHRFVATSPSACPAIGPLCGAPTDFFVFFFALPARGLFLM